MNEHVKLDFKVVFFLLVNEKIKIKRKSTLHSIYLHKYMEIPKHIKAQFVSSSKAKYTRIFDVSMLQIFNFMKSNLGLIAYN